MMTRRKVVSFPVIIINQPLRLHTLHADTSIEGCLRKVQAHNPIWTVHDRGEVGLAGVGIGW